MKPKNVQIPFDIFKMIITYLEYWDVSELDPGIQDEYTNILSALHKKRDSLDLRDYYSKIIHADDEDKRFSARMDYLQQKRFIQRIYD